MFLISLGSLGHKTVEGIAARTLLFLPHKVSNVGRHQGDLLHALPLQGTLELVVLASRLQMLLEWLSWEIVVLRTC